ncbi:unnamed protein product [Diplocarpon coronariae]
MAPALPAQRAPAAREEHGRTPKRTRRAARSLRASFVLGDRGDAPRTREVISPSPPVYYPPPVIPTKCAVQIRTLALSGRLESYDGAQSPRQIAGPGFFGENGARASGSGSLHPSGKSGNWRGDAGPPRFRLTSALPIPRRSPQMAVIQIDPAGRGEGGVSVLGTMVLAYVFSFLY